MQHIRTKWHHIAPLIEQEHIYLTAPQDGKCQFYKDMNLDVNSLKKFLDDINTLPRFVIDRELIDTATKGEYTQSLIDMKRAGVLHLPYREMVVEFQGKSNRNRNAHSIVVLKDLNNLDNEQPSAKWEGKDKTVPPLEGEKDKFDFYGVRMSVESDEQGEYFVISPSILYMSINSRDVVPTEKAAEWTDYEDDKCWLRMLGCGHRLMPPTKKTNDLVERTWQKDAGTVYYAAISGFLLMATAGVAKEYIDCEKINHKRGPGTGKEKIPAHTYIRIGHVYRSASSNESDEYVPRRSPRPHWRRGHIRGVHYGKGRAFLRSKYISPKLVAYHGKDQPELAKEYVVIK